jgi:hypothetical protein
MGEDAPLLSVCTVTVASTQAALLSIRLSGKQHVQKWRELEMVCPSDSPWSSQWTNHCVVAVWAVLLGQGGGGSMHQCRCENMTQC